MLLENGQLFVLQNAASGITNRYYRMGQILLQNVGRYCKVGQLLQSRVVQSLAIADSHGCRSIVKILTTQF